MQYAYWNGEDMPSVAAKRQQFEEEMREVDTLFRQQREACGKDENFANVSEKEQKQR